MRMPLPGSAAVPAAPRRLGGYREGTMKPKTSLIMVLAAGLAVGGLAFFLSASAEPKPPSPNGSPAGIVWLTNEAEARARSEAARKPLLIDFGAAWCASCVELEKRTYPDPEVRAKIAADFIALKVDCTEETPENRALQKKYGVQALPLVTFVDPRGHQLVEPRIEGFLKPKAFLAELMKVRGK